MTKKTKKLSVATALLATTAMAFGQTTAPTKPFAFDVASIRQNVDNRSDCLPVQLQPTARGFHMTNCELTMAIGAAYVPTTGNPLGYLVEDRIAGKPGWLDHDHFDLEARISDADAAAWQDPAKRKLMAQAMMQNLLTERCKLVVHREMRDKPIYALVVGKNGPKFKASEAKNLDAIRAQHPEAIAIPNATGFFYRTPGKIEIYDASIGTVALLLSGPAGRPVVDKTGLTGRYDMQIEMSQSASATANSDQGPSVFSAVQDQLGLKLESKKNPVEILVIDHIEHPSEN
jgi:uncharacterized protein (TIGR03435 family)